MKIGGKTSRLFVCTENNAICSEHKHTFSKISKDITLNLYSTFFLAVKNLAYVLEQDQLQFESLPIWQNVPLSS